MKSDIAAVWLFESSSAPGKVYQTLLYVDGTTSCECPGWKFKRATVRTCKHVRFVALGQADAHAKSFKRYSETMPATATRTRPEPVRGTGRKFNFD
jgi:hypothetical protein